MNQRTTPQILLIGGGAGSGKTSLARALADTMPGTALVHLDSCYHSDPRLAPSVPRLDGHPGRMVAYSDPRALDTARIKAALAEHRHAPLVIVEGTFALALPELTAIATWKVFVDTPADIRLVRKTLRKIEEGQDPAPGLRGYTTSSRSYTRHVAPTRDQADVILAGTQPPADLTNRLQAYLAASSESSEGDAAAPADLHRAQQSADGAPAMDVGGDVPGVGEHRGPGPAGREPAQPA
ncbi:zeta toxin family protein [Streptomyces sp. NPDC006662]|uniref:uridine kinase family protein n=1 Tax=Streptomyces sp. NPDC006662 TaxID=3156902 RepID=UPI0033E9F550